MQRGTWPWNMAVECYNCCTLSALKNRFLFSVANCEVHRTNLCSLVVSAESSALDKKKFRSTNKRLFLDCLHFFLLCSGKFAQEFHSQVTIATSQQIKKRNERRKNIYDNLIKANGNALELQVNSQLKFPSTLRIHFVALLILRNFRQIFRLLEAVKTISGCASISCDYLNYLSQLFHVRCATSLRSMPSRSVHDHATIWCTISIHLSHFMPVAQSTIIVVDEAIIQLR